MEANNEFRRELSETKLITTQEKDEKVEASEQEEATEKIEASEASEKREKEEKEKEILYSMSLLFNPIYIYIYKTD